MPRASRPKKSPEHCTPPSTHRLACCRCSPPATGGTSAESPAPTMSIPRRPRFSSTTDCPVAPVLPSAVSSSPPSGFAPPMTPSGPVHVAPGAPVVFSHRSVVRIILLSIRRLHCYCSKSCCATHPQLLARRTRPRHRASWPQARALGRHHYLHGCAQHRAFVDAHVISPRHLMG